MLDPEKSTDDPLSISLSPLYIYELPQISIEITQLFIVHATGPIVGEIQGTQLPGNVSERSGDYWAVNGLLL